MQRLELSPLATAYDFYCGLGGWAEGLLAEGFEVTGYDIERHDYGTGGYPGRLVLRNVLNIHGSEVADAAILVASPPCIEYSYMAMPWKRAKQIARALRGKDEFPPDYKGSRTIEQLNALFNACFRIQREAIEAAGRYIPLIVENVRGAQPWVGRSTWNFGSYHLWGDVPALMPIPSRSSQKVPGFRFDGNGGSFQTACVKITGQDWSNYAKTGKVSPHWRMELLKQRGESSKGNGSWFGDYKEAKAAGRGSANRYTSSNSIARKAASAQIAKIPFPLAHHIAKCFRHTTEVANGGSAMQPAPQSGSEEKENL